MSLVEGEDMSDIGDPVDMLPSVCSFLTMGFLRAGTPSGQVHYDNKDEKTKRMCLRGCSHLSGRGHSACSLV
jgi:hypothetical protein